MRFLIVDDDPDKTNRLSFHLASQGISEADIVCCDSASAARKILAVAPFDAMLIDVLIPARSGESPLGINSIELLRQIIDDGTSIAPRYIVGVTADPKALKDFELEFRKMTLQVIHVDVASDDWKERLSNFVTYMKRAQSADAAYRSDVCVLNALRNPELEAILSLWPLKQGSENLLNSSVVFRDGSIDFGSGEKKIICAHPAQMGPIASAHAAEAIIRHFRPRVLIMTGICGGFSDQVSLGDIVVAERSWDWQSGKWSDEGVLLPAPEQRMGSAELIAHSRTIPQDFVKIMHERYAENRPDYCPKIVVGPMVTGSSVVASNDIQKAFRNQHRKMVAVDMECFGVYYAAAVSAGPRTEVLCVKSVSDLADREKTDDFQRYCSHMSAGLGLEILKRYFTN